MSVAMMAFFQLFLYARGSTTASTATISSPLFLSNIVRSAKSDSLTNAFALSPPLRSDSDITSITRAQLNSTSLLRYKANIGHTGCSAKNISVTIPQRTSLPMHLITTRLSVAITTNMCRIVNILMLSARLPRGAVNLITASINIVKNIG